MIKFLVIFVTIWSTIRMEVVNVGCSFGTEDFKSVREIYICEVNQITTINEKNQEISFDTNDHNEGNDNSKVLGVKFDTHRMSYFPQLMLKTFPNLIAIYINDGNLKEIHQSDLQFFTALRFLDLFANHLEVIEADLFKFNPNLEVIWLSNNKIRFIDSKVFDHLTKLNYLYLMDNICIEQSETNRTEVLKLIENVKKECSGTKIFTTTTTTMRNFPFFSRPRLTPEIAEISTLKDKLKSCEEELGHAHQVMEVKLVLTEIQFSELKDENSNLQEENSGLRTSRNVLLFFVVALGLVVIGLGLLFYRSNGSRGSAVRYFS